MSDTDGMVRLMEHAADVAAAAIDRQVLLSPQDAAVRVTHARTIAALALCEATLRMVAASVTPALSETVRREIANAHRDDIDEPSEPVAVEPKALNTILSVRLPSDVAAALRDHAAQLGQSTSDAVRGAVLDLLNSMEGGESASRD